MLKMFWHLCWSRFQVTRQKTMLSGTTWYLGDAARQQTTEAVTAHADESEQRRSREDQTVVTIARI